MKKTEASSSTFFRNPGAGEITVILGPPRTCSNLLNRIMKPYFNGSIVELSMIPGEEDNESDAPEDVEKRIESTKKKIEQQFSEGKRSLIAKDTSPLWTDKVVDELLPYMSEHFIVIVRKPKEQMLSLFERKINDRLDEFGSTKYTLEKDLNALQLERKTDEVTNKKFNAAVQETAAKVPNAWKKLDAAARRLIAKGKTMIVVDSEDLTIRPEETIKRVCRLLGKEFNPQCLDLKKQGYQFSDFKLSTHNAWIHDVVTTTKVEEKQDRGSEDLDIPAECVEAANAIEHIYSEYFLPKAREGVSSDPTPSF